MFDLIFYSVAVPLIFLLLITSILFEVQSYAVVQGEAELKLFAQSLADILVNSPGGARSGLAKSVQVSLLEEKAYPNEFVNRSIGDFNWLPKGIGVHISLNNTDIGSVNVTGDFYTVRRYGLIDGDPVVLEVSVYQQ